MLSPVALFDLMSMEGYTVLSINKVRVVIVFFELGIEAKQEKRDGLLHIQFSAIEF
jgi:hypothetical protein